MTEHNSGNPPSADSTTTANIPLNIASLSAMFGRKRTAVLLGVFIGITITIALIPSFGENIDRSAIDVITRIMSHWRAPKRDLVVVGIDAATLAAIPDRWPWPRNRYAELLDAIGKTKPYLIVFDILLQHAETSDNGAGDAKLIETMQRLKNVYLISIIEQQKTENDLLKRHYKSDNIFRKAAAGEGFAWVLADSDGVVRTFVIRDALMDNDSCALALARRLLNSEPAIPKADKDGLSCSLIAFANRGGSIPTISALDFLEGRMPQGSLEGKVVFLGAVAPILHDFHQTCIGLVAGPKILATELDTIIQNRIAVRCKGKLWRLLLISFGIIFAAFSIYRRINMAWTIFFIGITSCLCGWVILFLFAGICLPLFPLVAGYCLGGGATIALLRLNELLSLQILQAEAAAAGAVQRQLFPPPAWENEKFMSFGCCTPCSAAGGDYFDSVQINNDCRLFLVNDVAGHGVGAAMVASMLKALTAAIAGEHDISLETLTKQFNTILYRLFKGKKMVTGVFCKLDIASHQLNILSAGHVPSMLVKKNGDVEEIALPSLPLGVRENIRTNRRQLTLNHGDTLVMYTDGIVEMVDWDGNPLGYDAWKSILAANAPIIPNSETVNRLLNSVAAHSGGREPSDDVTLLLVHRKIA